MTEKKQNSFILYHDTYEKIRTLPLVDLGILFKMIYEYEINGIMLDTDNSVIKMAFSFIRAELDRNRQRYVSVCNRNKNNIKKRYTKTTTGKSGIPKPTKSTDNDNDTDTDNIYIDQETPVGERTTKDPDTHKTGAIKKQEYIALFERIWQHYPNKKGKEVARSTFVKQPPSEFDRIFSGVRAYAAEVAGKDKAYIKHGSTFFRQKTWLDYEETENKDRFSLWE
jgi:hypothetical protein